MGAVANSVDMVNRSKEAIASDAMQQYFKDQPNALRAAMVQCNITDLNQLNGDAEKHGAFWQNFWEQLPDSPRIRYGAFFEVCDLAEWYCFGER